MIVLKRHTRFFLVGIIMMTLSSCIEPFTAETQTFENALVVDVLLTNELRRHTVKLSRTYTFESEGPTAESNAQVRISDDMGSSYLFSETDSGIYRSIEIFNAVPGRSYILDITTTDGKSYISESVVAPKNVLITNLYAERETNDLGEEGVSIRLDNDTDSSEPTYFRYDYEETYKIIAPKYDPFKFEVIDYTPCDGNFYEVGIKPRTEEQRVCYASRKSVGIKQATTISLTGNELSNFLVRYINREDYIISHRYSILVRQYTQTRNAYSYYESLNDFSSTESIFSDTQPGFLFGNIFSRNDLEEKVLGYFEVSSVNEQRTYFNYADLFPNEELPPYAVNCDITGNPELVGRGYHCDGNVCDGACESPLIEAILAGLVVFQSENENISREMPGPYFTLPSPCGDCTKLGSNIVPDFWEEKRI